MRRISAPHASKHRIALPALLAVLCAVAIILVPAASPRAAQQGPGKPDGLEAQIHARIKAARHHRVVCSGRTVCRSEELGEFYAKRNFTPAWSRDLVPLDSAAAALKTLGNAALQGLRPEDYHVKEIERLLDRIHKPVRLKPARVRMLADLDLLLTDGFLLYASDMSTGRVDPKMADRSWHIHRQKADHIALLLENALATGDFDGAIQQVAPGNPQYGRLVESLAKYREIARKGGWPRVPAGKSLKPGDRDRRIPVLRERLEASGDLVDDGGAAPECFDDKLEEALKRFQERHGIDADGRLGPKTLAALNVSVGGRIRQIEVNLERWRWLPRDFGGRYVLVNVPGFNLKAYENSQDVLSMGIIVGKRYWSTPVFESKLNRVVLNPYWVVPRNIAVRDIVPKIRKIPGYLDKEAIKVFYRGKAVDPKTINWSRLSGRFFPYELRQEPGPKNALGRIMFKLPNSFAIYLHDTPERRLFERSARGFSHGCIRVEDPIDLAAYLLEDDPQWTREGIEAAIDTGETQEVRIPNPAVTYILYLTAWVDEDGTVQFPQDIYNRDRAVARALEAAQR